MHFRLRMCDNLFRAIQVASEVRRVQKNETDGLVVFFNDSTNDPNNTGGARVQVTRIILRLPHFRLRHMRRAQVVQGALTVGRSRPSRGDRQGQTPVIALDREATSCMVRPGWCHVGESVECWSHTRTSVFP